MYDLEFTQSIKIPVVGLFDRGQFLTAWVLDLTTSEHQRTIDLACVKKLIKLPLCTEIPFDGRVMCLCVKLDGVGGR